MKLKPCAWSPSLQRLGPDYEGPRVWADGAPNPDDLAFWSSEGESIILAYREQDVDALETVLKLALHQTYEALNDLILECHDSDGSLRTPSRLVIIRARKLLPEKFSKSLSAKRA